MSLHCSIMQRADIDSGTLLHADIDFEKNHHCYLSWLRARSPWADTGQEPLRCTMISMVEAPEHWCRTYLQRRRVMSRRIGGLQQRLVQTLMRTLVIEVRGVLIEDPLQRSWCRCVLPYRQFLPGDRSTTVGEEVSCGEAPVAHALGAIDRLGHSPMIATRSCVRMFCSRSDSRDRRARYASSQLRDEQRAVADPATSAPNQRHLPGAACARCG